MTEYIFTLCDRTRNPAQFKTRCFQARSFSEAKTCMAIYAGIEIGMHTFSWESDNFLMIKGDHLFGIASLYLTTIEQRVLNQQRSMEGKKTTEAMLLKAFFNHCAKLGVTQDVVALANLEVESCFVEEAKRRMDQTAKQTDLEILTSGDDLPEV